MIKNKTKREKEIDQLYRLFIEVNRSFYIWKALQKSSFDPLYKRNSLFWASTWLGLKQTYMMGLARIFEIDNNNSIKDKGVIAVANLVNKQDDSKRRKKVEKILKRLGEPILRLHKVRNAFLAHNNAKSILNPDRVMKDYNLTFNDIEKLIKAAPEILHCLHPEDSHGYSFDNDRCKDDVDRLIQMLCHSYKLEQKQLKAFLEGKTDEHKFPPKKCIGSHVTLSKVKKKKR